MTGMLLSEAYIRGVLARKQVIFEQERQLGRCILATLVVVTVVEYVLLAALVIWG